MQTQGEAKRFFVDRILAQASRDDVPLSDNERWMLGFSESDPEFVVDPERLSAFEAEIPDQAFEAKVARLIRRAYEHDLELDSEARAVYRDARDSLSRGDHYLLVMIDQALGPRRRRGLAGAFAKTAVLLLLVPATAIALIFAAGLAWIVLSGQTHSVRDAMPFALGFILLAWMTWYLSRLMIREIRS